MFRFLQKAATSLISLGLHLGALFIIFSVIKPIADWYLTKNPTLSVIILTLINSAVFIPTIRKTINDPTSETLSSYVIHATRHSLSILALSNYSISTFLYPLVTALMNVIVTLIIIRPSLKKIASSS